MSNTGRKSKHCLFTFSTNKLDCRERLKNEVKDFPFYAYIDHSPDSEEGSEHTHFLIRSSPITLDNLSRKIDLPVNFIQIVRLKRSIIRYLIHFDNPEKTQYNREDIVTNDWNVINAAFEDSNSPDINSEFDSFSLLRKGIISPSDYISSHYMDIVPLGFFGRLRVYSLLSDSYCKEERRLN